MGEHGREHLRDGPRGTGHRGCRGLVDERTLLTTNLVERTPIQFPARRELRGVEIDRVTLHPGVELSLRAIRSLIGSRVTDVPVGLCLDQRRATTATRSIHRLTNALVHRVPV